MKATVYIATSVDGFIARENGGIDWLPDGEEIEDGEDYGVSGIHRFGRCHCHGASHLRVGLVIRLMAVW